MLSANDDGQSFSESMEVLKKYAHGVSDMQGPRILWMLLNVRCIVPNDYAVGAEMSPKVAKQVYLCVHCSACRLFCHLFFRYSLVLSYVYRLIKSYFQ
jgi:hypothetical protein